MTFTTKLEQKDMIKIKRQMPLYFFKNLISEQQHQLNMRAQ